MCDAVKGDGNKCDKPVKAGTRCGIHKDKDAAVDPVDAIAAGVAAIPTHDVEEEEEEEEEEDDDDDDVAPAGGAGGAPRKTKEQKAADAAALVIYKTKPLGEMSVAEKDAALVFLRDFHTHTLKKRAEAQQKVRENNKKKGLTGSGKKKVTPWEAAANRVAGMMRSSRIEVSDEQMATLISNELAKHKAKCSGCEHPHA